MVREQRAFAEASEPQEQAPGGRSRERPARQDDLPQAPTQAEWMRWATESRSPGELIPYLIETGQIQRYPEIAAIVDVPQDKEWHPEGPVHVHTRHVLNAAADIADREGLEGEVRAVNTFAALTHDFGKATTTKRREKRGRMRWTSYGHDKEGGPLATRFLKRLGIPQEIIAQVVPLVEHHMAYRNFGRPDTGVRAVEKLAERLAPASLQQLAFLIEADHSGRPPLPKGLPPAAKRMLELARQEPTPDQQGK
ncbi:MAG TPA: HD domain-containing protein [Chthonomonadaceae bacterium]|nr:HD domain-containing protein [Chthonomonadaceae bacterium]